MRWPRPFHFIVTRHDRWRIRRKQRSASAATTRRAEINGARVSRIRTFVKQVEAALAAGDKDQAAEALSRVQPELARGVAKGVLHKNTAARKLSRLTRASRRARLSRL